MITPPFQVTQDEEFLYVHMKIKYIKASECDFFIGDTLFKFYCKPYFLRLNFSHHIVEDGRESAAYDLEKGELRVRVAKKTPGEVFENLDMVSLLLGIPTTVVTHEKSEMEDLTHIKAAEGEEDEDDEEERIYSKFVFNLPQNRAPGPSPSIQFVDQPAESRGDVLSDAAPANNGMENGQPLMDANEPIVDSEGANNVENDEEMELDEEEIDWSHPQTVPRPFSEAPTFAVSYGFMDLYQGYFDVDRPDSVDLTDPDGIPADARRKMRLLSENSDFNFDHYIADFMDPSSIESVRQYRAQWTVEYELLVKLETNPTLRPTEAKEGLPITSLTRNDEIAVTWTDAHRDVLIKLPKREYPDDSNGTTMLGLVDLMFAYAYNLRTMEGENTVESAWTIVKLSSILSWFDKLETLQEALLSSARRSLIYPLYRNWALVQVVLQDVYQLFCLGKRAILRALIEMKQLCDMSETKHILSRLYLNDYCVWIQKVPRKRFASLATQILGMCERITKEDVGLPLLELEALATEDSMAKDDGQMHVSENDAM